jgi:hypothetical protein
MSSEIDVMLAGDVKHGIDAASSVAMQFHFGEASKAVKSCGYALLQLGILRLSIEARRRLREP